MATIGRFDTNSDKDIRNARQTVLFEILWNERYLTRQQLIVRVELKVGRNCFGNPSKTRVFRKDLQVVKQKLKQAGYTLVYHRKKGQMGYYLQGQPALSNEFKRMLHGSIAETDQQQIDIYQRLSTAERFRQGCVISDTARNVVAYRIRLGNPSLSEEEANHLALQRAYHP